MMNSRKVKGQALVEFAFILPIIILLVFGVIEFGRAFQVKIVLENAVREGAHYMIYDKEDPDNGFPNTIFIITEELKDSGVIISAGDVVVQCLTAGVVNDPITDCPQGSTVEVIVTTDLDLTLIGLFVNPFILQSNARMLVP